MLNSACSVLLPGQFPCSKKHPDGSAYFVADEPLDLADAHQMRFLDTFTNAMKDFRMQEACRG
jgi:hypothetical protein